MCIRDRDTTINGRPFALHIVQPHETIYGIARKYNAELNQIVVHNPSIIQGLRIGIKILVPLQKPRVDEKKEGSKILNVFNDTATTEIYTSLFVGSVRCV